MIEAWTDDDKTTAAEKAQANNLLNRITCPSLRRGGTGYRRNVPVNTTDDAGIVYERRSIDYTCAKPASLQIDESAGAEKVPTPSEGNATNLHIELADKPIQPVEKGMDARGSEVRGCRENAPGHRRQGSGDSQAPRRGVNVSRHWVATPER
jgi:hypothetical protein